MSTSHIKTGIAMSNIINIKKHKPKKMGISCKYCYHFMPGYCVEFGIDITSTANAKKCKRYSPKGFKSPDYISKTEDKSIKNRITLSVTEFIEFTGVPYSESEIKEMAILKKCEKLKKKGRFLFHVAKSFGKDSPKIIVKNRELEIVVIFE